MKKITILLLTVIIGLGLLVGCNKKQEVYTETTKEPTTEVDQEKTNETKTETTQDGKLVGTMDEIKDSIFTVVNDKNEAYTFNYDKKKMPEGLDKVNAGDKVEVYYTGSASVVDAFTGEVISVNIVK